MAKTAFDESGDSEDLQALFDSIAAGSPKPKLEVVHPADSSGDCDELQALFDNVSGEAAKGAPHAEAVHDHSCDGVFQKVGQMTRQLHDTLRELGYDKALQEAAHALPDATSRLLYVAQMTEQAASRVLNATDIAKPIQDGIHDRSSLLGEKWDQLYANRLPVEEFKLLAAETRAFLHDVPRQIAASNAQLMEIMMAQDFQDLTGQVIKKVVDLAQKMETELLQVLVASMPEQMRGEAGGSLKNGPVISAVGRKDVVTDQAQVDDLLESLGF
ncbi:MAG: protein phosphatase CheZ [Sterolibacteriaceae bacterium]|nr:protein phosphatase CheZ [Sterolibacteriaceae bacterium]MBK9085521.1 protein phosphatase CheZ [Sterolibacteriaceae bacterium]